MESSDNYTIYFNVLEELGEEAGTEDDIRLYKDELTYKRQFLIYILELKSDVQISEGNIDDLQSKYTKEITELKELIGNKSSIPKDQVYPKFDNLSQIYSQLLEEKNLAILRKELFKVLLEFKELNIEATSLQESLIKKAKVLYVEKAQRLAEYEAQIAQNMESQQVGDPDQSILRLMPNNTPDFMHIKIKIF